MVPDDKSVAPVRLMALLVNVPPLVKLSVPLITVVPTSVKDGADTLTVTPDGITRPLKLPLGILAAETLRLPPMA